MMGNCDMNILYDCRGSENDAPKGSHHCAVDCTWGGGHGFADHCTLFKMRVGQMRMEVRC